MLTYTWFSKRQSNVQLAVNLLSLFTTNGSKQVHTIFYPVRRYFNDFTCVKKGWTNKGYQHS